MRRNDNWTQREDSIARKMRDQGADNRAIGERLGRSSGAVKRRFYWLGLSPEKRKEVARTRKRGDRGGSYARIPDDAREAILKAYLADRVVGNELARQYGLSPTYARKLAEARGEASREVRYDHLRDTKANAKTSPHSQDSPFAIAHPQ